MKFSAIVLATVLMTGVAHAGDAPGFSGTCLAPIKAGDADPIVRDVQLVFDGDHKGIKAKACIASNSVKPFFYVGLTIDIFKDDGSLISTVAATYRNIVPITPAPPGQPSVIQSFKSNNPRIDPKYAGHLHGHVVVEMKVCMAGNAVGNCAAAEDHFTYLIPAVALDVALAGKGKRHR